MKIYDRDYTKLTENEIKQWNDIREKEKIFINGKVSGFKKVLYRQYPKACRHYLSLFPNNYLDIEDLQDKERLQKLNQNFLELLNQYDTSERRILNYIKENEAYFMIASILKSNFNFGHHNTFIIPEFMLGISYKADYLLIGRNSGGYEFVFVELESPYGNVTLGDGELGEVYRKGIKQVRDWEEWIEGNYASLNEVFNKYKHPQMDLPQEFNRLDKTRIHFVVVAGRRKDFMDRTYRLKRQLKETQKITIFHYDNLYEFAENIIGEATY